ncbi:hypothetical protein Leryth_002848, partial [Lithospermum erythrorhizon]
SWNPVFSQIAFLTLLRSLPLSVLPTPSCTENDTILVLAICLARNSCGGILLPKQSTPSSSSSSSQHLLLLFLKLFPVYSSLSILDQSGTFTGSDEGAPPVVVVVLSLLAGDEKFLERFCFICVLEDVVLLFHIMSDSSNSINVSVVGLVVFLCSVLGRKL